MTAASVAAVLLDLDDVDAVSALRISAACIGGDLPNPRRRRLARSSLVCSRSPVSMPPAPPSEEASAAPAGALESIAAKVLGEPWNPADHDPTPAIMRVTFKRHAAPMFAQAIIEALEGAGEIDEPVNQVVVHVAPFAAGYASDGTGRQLGVASIPDLVSATIAELPTDRRAFPEAIPRASGCGAQCPRGPRGAAHGGRTGAAAPRKRGLERLVERCTSPRGADPGRGRSARVLRRGPRSTRRRRRRRPPSSCWMRGKRPSSPGLVDLSPPTSQRWSATPRPSIIRRSGTVVWWHTLA